MSTRSTNLKAKALSLLSSSNFGQSVSFSRTSGGSYDPSTSSITGSSTSTFTANAAPTNFNKFEIDGQTVLASDIKLIVSNSGTAPAVGDTVTVSSIIYRVLNVNPIVLNEDDVIYILQVRK